MPKRVERGDLAAKAEMINANLHLVVSKLSWVVGSSSASVVWIVLFSAVLGWPLGSVSSAFFRRRTHAPR